MVDAVGAVPTDAPVHLVVMGVSGTGKTTVALQLEALLGWEFLEGDSLHPRRNVEKMASGHPLTDQDRAPWLQALADWTGVQHADGRSTVMTCSALRRSYRNMLTADAPGTYFVHLVGDPALILSRMQGRQHFMPPSMLQSQLTTLEPLEPGEDGGEFDVADPPDVIAARVVERLGLSPAATPAATPARPAGDRAAPRS
ncbi:gluconokinase [Aquipuribacter sp. MA13-6]|uniref:gluconokinase n=1 Tax=unclassified Aquipuribacter TaxID=2635084 RepID=UPI003EE9F526